MSISKHPPHLPAFERRQKPVILFLTICTHERKSLLACDDACALLQSAWRNATTWSVGRFILLPDHLHLFCAPADPDQTGVAQWVGYWKRLVTKEWPDRNALPIWQREFWDRQLRSEDHYHQRWEYVRNNPVRHGLVRNADQWKWQGEMNVLRW